MSKKTIAVIVLSILVLGGGVVGFFVYRNVSDTPAQVIEQTENLQVPPNTSKAGADDEDMTANKTVLSGAFVDGDAVHSGKGTASVIETSDGPVLSFSEDFVVTSGPDLFVYLSPNAAGEDLGEFVSLGRLKSFDGAQAYNLPDNFADYKTVVIWCRAFSVTFATAELK